MAAAERFQTIGVRHLADHSSDVLRGVVEDDDKVLVSRNGRVVGVLVASSLEDVAERGLLGESEQFLAIREFDRGNMSAHVARVVGGSHVVITRHNVPQAIMLPIDAAVASGLLDGFVRDDSGRGGPNRELSAEEAASRMGPVPSRAATDAELTAGA